MSFIVRRRLWLSGLAVLAALNCPVSTHTVTRGTGPRAAVPRTCRGRWLLRRDGDHALGHPGHRQRELGHLRRSGKRFQLRNALCARLRPRELRHRRGLRGLRGRGGGRGRTVGGREPAVERLPLLDRKRRIPGRCSHADRPGDRHHSRPGSVLRRHPRDRNRAARLGARRRRGFRRRLRRARRLSHRIQRRRTDRPRLHHGAGLRDL